MSSLMVLKTGRDRQCGTSLSSPLLSSRIRGFLWLCHTRKGLFAASIAQETVTRSVWNAMKRAELSAGTVMVVVQLATGTIDEPALPVVVVEAGHVPVVTAADDRRAAIVAEKERWCPMNWFDFGVCFRTSCTPSSSRK